jgi:hypothetical protein
MQAFLGSDKIIDTPLSDSTGHGSTGYNKRDVDVRPIAYTQDLRIRLTCAQPRNTTNMFMDSVSFFAL